RSLGDRVLAQVERRRAGHGGLQFHPGPAPRLPGRGRFTGRVDRAAQHRRERVRRLERRQRGRADRGRGDRLRRSRALDRPAAAAARDHHARACVNDMLIPGRPYPLGATLRDGGVNFAVASEHATAIELCTFDGAGVETRERLPGHDDGVWHGFLPGAGPGLVYGFRAHGPWAPARAHLFNPSKLLLDPHAREIVGEFEWDDAHYGHVHGLDELVLDTRDSAAIMPKARVAAPLAGPASAPLHTPAADTVLYELHVKGFTKLNP